MSKRERDRANKMMRHAVGAVHPATTAGVRALGSACERQLCPCYAIAQVNVCRRSPCLQHASGQEQSRGSCAKKCQDEILALDNASL
jgi:hypothetical protein